jgi:hypothetical protein
MIMQPTKIVTVPNPKLLAEEGVPRIKIAGQDWPVPLLAPRQNNIILPLLLKPRPSNLEDLATTERLTEIGTIVFHAMQRGHRELTRDEFDDMPISFVEMIAAIPTIQTQTGLFKPVARNGVNTGEVVGTSTGTP